MLSSLPVSGELVVSVVSPINCDVDVDFALVLSVSMDDVVIVWLPLNVSILRYL